jgi:hypothetical protein
MIIVKAHWPCFQNATGILESRFSLNLGKAHWFQMHFGLHFRLYFHHVMPGAAPATVIQTQNLIWNHRDDQFGQIIIVSFQVNSAFTGLGLLPLRSQRPARPVGRQHLLRLRGGGMQGPHLVVSTILCPLAHAPLKMGV